MPGSITLPQIVLELEEEDRKRYQALQPPKSIVVRYGYLRLIAELAYDGADKPGCGSKVVIRTDRGTEIAEMLTTTCSNSGCGKSVTRQEMLNYIEESGGRNFPFSTSGKVLRVATPEDLLEQQKLDARKPESLRFAKQQVKEANLPMHLVDVEMLLGGERILFHYTSEQWVDFRELVRVLAGELQTRIEMHQVNARDEARIVADFERCGQHCCCKQFLKVLKPVSMRMAKVQKATLDPAKISGRCGRLMCCLRYEDETYETLRKKLPHKQSRVMTEQGPATVLDGQILTQLVLVKLDNNEVPQAVPVEEIKPLPRDQDPQFNRPPAATVVTSQNQGHAQGNRPAPPAGRSPYPQRDNKAPSRAGDSSSQPGRNDAARPSGSQSPENQSSSQPRSSNGDSPSTGYQRRPQPGKPTREPENQTPAQVNPPEEDIPPLAETPAGDNAYPDTDALEANIEMHGDDVETGDVIEAGDAATSTNSAESTDAAGGNEADPNKRRRKRRRRRRRRGGPADGPSGGSPPPSDNPPQ